MADPITWALILGGITAGISAKEVSDQNKAARKTGKAVVAAGDVKGLQLAHQAGQEEVKEISRTRQIVGRIRVKQGESGVNLAPIEQQTVVDSSINLETISSNLANNLAFVSSQTNVKLAGLSSKMQSPLLAGAKGGLQGFSTGLSIAGGIQNLGQAGELNTLATSAAPDSSIYGGAGNVKRLPQ